MTRTRTHARMRARVGHEDEEVELRKQAIAFQSYLRDHKDTAATQGVFAYR